MRGQLSFRPLIACAPLLFLGKVDWKRLEANKIAGATANRNPRIVGVPRCPLLAQSGHAGRAQWCTAPFGHNICTRQILPFRTGNKTVHRIPI
jgi:hypothetical protein